LLEDALQQTHFHELDFYPNHFYGVRYIDFIVSCVRADTRLMILNLNFVEFEVHEFDSICAALNNHTSLEEVKLVECPYQDGSIFEVVTKLKSNTLQKISLVGTYSWHLEPNDMSEFLSSNPSLKEFTVDGNTFNGQDLVYIADTMMNNTTLRKLSLELNNFPNNSVGNLQSSIDQA